MKKYHILLVFLLFAGFIKAELLNYPLDTINGEVVYRYQVEKSIGLYRIGVNFDVSQNDIVRLNPQLRERGLHYGETLYIPTGLVVGDKPATQQTSNKQNTIEEQETASPETAIQEVAIETTQTTSDNIETLSSGNEIVLTETIATDTLRWDSLAVDSIDFSSIFDSLAMDTAETRRVIELALMLPFESNLTKRSANAERMLEFYQGALLAMRERQHDSVLYRLRVFDTERSERRVSALLDSTELDSVKGILGLAYPVQIDKMAEWCKTHQVPLLLPFNDDNPLSENPQLLQFNATNKQEADSICSWIIAHNENCIAIEVRDAEPSNAIRTLYNTMQEKGITYKTLELHGLLNDEAQFAFSKTKENLVILHTEKFQHARILLPHLLKLQEEGFPIRIVSQYSWQKESIPLPQIYTSMFFEEIENSGYDMMWEYFYSNKHTSSTPRFDILGYDLMYALIGWLHGETESYGLQSTIRWNQVQEGGYINANVQVIQKD